MAPASRSLRVRPLRAADYDDVIALLAASKMDPHTRGRESPAAFRRQLAAFPATYLGAFDGDRLVGCAFGTHDVRKAWINRLAVHPEYRRRGIATRLVRECERRFLRQGMEMFVAVIDAGNRTSRALFRSLGYDLWNITYARKKRRPDV
ncbi:MAG: hypothetical protein A3K68_07450 [Euryarchaeota archaeon RBG_16_68_13]|nr:MAG: hypothetical protein A3K68_07450 [Euryarchaeota archaeon RBG_16_68_13]